MKIKNKLKRKKLHLNKLKRKIDKEEISASFQTVTSRNGAYSAAAIAIVILIAVVTNLVCGQLSARVQQIDISSNKIYEISSSTKEMLQSLEDDIIITVVAEKDSVDERLLTFLEKYTALSKKLTLEQVDPVLHPSALTEYQTEADSVVVSCEATDLSTQISISDILVQDSYAYYYGSSSVTSFDGDGQLTAAINLVCGSEERKVYYLTDHGEVQLSDTITSLLTKSGIMTEGLSLLIKNEIPEDCDLIIANGIASDLAEDEVKLLNKYIKNGGNVLLMLSEQSPDSGNIVKFMKNYGISQEEGYVADMERNYQQNYYYIFPNVSATGNLSKNLNTGMVLLKNSKGFTLEDDSETISTESILETSSYGYMVTEEDQEQGTFVVGAKATSTVSSEDEETSDVITGTLTVYGASSMIDESLTAAFSGLDNNTLFMNSVTAAIGDSSNIAIEAKSLSVQYNTPQYGGWISVAIIFIIPLGIVIAGFVIWMRRRKA